MSSESIGSDGKKKTIRGAARLENLKREGACPSVILEGAEEK